MNDVKKIKEQTLEYIKEQRKKTNYNDFIHFIWCVIKVQREEEKLDNKKDNEKIDINSLRVEDLKNELKKRNVDIPKTAKKKDLQELLMNLDK